MLPNLIHSQLKLNFILIHHVFFLYRIKKFAQYALIPEPPIRMPHHLTSKVGNLYYFFLILSYNLHSLNVPYSQNHPYGRTVLSRTFPQPQPKRVKNPWSRCIKIRNSGPDRAEPRQPNPSRPFK